MPVLQPNTMICRAGALTRLVGVYVYMGAVVAVIGGMFVYVGKKVGVIVDSGVDGVADAFVAPITTGVGLNIEGVRVGSTKGVGGLYGRG